MTTLYVNEKDLAEKLSQSWRVVKVDDKPVWKKLN